MSFWISVSSSSLTLRLTVPRTAWTAPPEPPPWSGLITTPDGACTPGGSPPEPPCWVAGFTTAVVPLEPRSLLQPASKPSASPISSTFRIVVSPGGHLLGQYSDLLLG